MQILDKDAHKASHAVKLYMLELYCDELMDLLRVVDKDKKGSPDVRVLSGASPNIGTVHHVAVLKHASHALRRVLKQLNTRRIAGTGISRTGLASVSSGLSCR